ncbi:MAG: 2OG-Fe(II) oxygenase family protein [Halioglobus sp.]
MLSPSLNFDKLALEYRADQRIRIANVLQPESAQELQTLFHRGIPFDHLMFLRGENRAYSADEMAAMSEPEKRSVQETLVRQAGDGVGFLYGGYRLTDGRAKNIESLAPLQRFFEYINSEAMLEFVRRVTGETAIVGADGQATQYTAGNFLTRHRDDPVGEKRRVAYVFGFSNGWHPDWGGLLQFFEENGTPRDAWLPQFNTLSLFDVRHIHSVTYVTPFAKAPRQSVTGWFHAN